MNDLRKDPITGRWVIIATDRLLRPHDFQKTKIIEETSPDRCPLCPGHEAMTPPEIWRWENPDHSWSVRVIPNKFPVLRIEGDLLRRGEGMFDHISGIGAHELIVDSPVHSLTLEDYDAEQIFRILSAYKIRLDDLKKDARLRYGLVFKNFGMEAGASLRHPHSQLIALPIIPKNVKEELSSCRDYYELKERCLFCDIISDEMEHNKRIILESERHIALAPYASRFPFEICILPKKHEACFTRIGEKELKDLASLMDNILEALDRSLSSPPFNYMLHSRPFRVSERHPETTLDLDYHWHIEIIPRLTKIAGFEWGTGFYINPTPPEEAAKALREAID
ncbi:galactose-1-phosphate uridylyltransferase [Candidatus Sumerlaeota bacterium]|nr:galactose-1-phosphate uridylyltransferase [Candidatus Sumerlaeota bacterium]